MVSVAVPPHNAAEESGMPGVISDCHFSVQLNHFIPVFLSYSVAVFLKWQSDITLGMRYHSVELFVKSTTEGQERWNATVRARPGAATRPRRS
jgi:hypothetical protein